MAIFSLRCLSWIDLVPDAVVEVFDGLIQLCRDIREVKGFGPRRMA